MIFDLCEPMMMAGCIESLLKLTQSNQSVENIETLEEIVRTISRSGGVRLSNDS